MMDESKGNESIINLNDEEFDYQYDNNVKTKSDESEKIVNGLTLEDVWKMELSSIKSEKNFIIYMQKLLDSMLKGLCETK